MIVSWSVIIGLFIFCMKRTLQPQPNNNNEDQKPEADSAPESNA